LNKPTIAFTDSYSPAGRALTIAFVAKRKPAVDEAASL
jgi:hypothetical protein